MPVASLTLPYSVSLPIRFLFRFDCFVIENVLTHLDNFQKLSAVSNTVIIAHFYLKMLTLF